jgi:tetratricopeptide (TPR) repeat protein
MLREYQGTLIRWLFGVGFLGLAYRMATVGYLHTNFAEVLGGVLCFVVGICFLWKTIFHLATLPLTRMVDSLFFPGGKLSKPLLNLKLPAYYINEGRYDEALIEYQKILKYYPDEAEAYEKAIWLFLDIFPEPHEAEKLRQRAKRRRVALDDRITRMIAAKQEISGT